MRKFRCVRVAAVTSVATVLTVSGLTVLQSSAAGESASASLVTIVPCRLADTRATDQVGGRGTPLAAGESATFTVWGDNGNCTIPSTALGIATNVTIANPTSASFLTLYPAAAPRPLSSNLNWTATSSPTPNQVTVGLSATGAVEVYNNSGTVNVIIDIVGYYVPAAETTVTGPVGPIGPTGPGGPVGPAGPTAEATPHDWRFTVIWLNSAGAMRRAVILPGGGIVSTSDSGLTSTRVGTGKYCLNASSPADGAVASLQSSGNKVGSVNVTMNHGNPCNNLGTSWIFVETYELS